MRELAKWRAGKGKAVEVPPPVVAEPLIAGTEDPDATKDK
jgi:hypothetical protein